MKRLDIVTRTRNRKSESCEPCDQNPKQEFETSRDQSSKAKMAKDNNDSRKGSDKSKRRGNHNQGGNRNQFRGQNSKQSKAVLKFEPAPEPTGTTSVKILDEMNNEVKEKLPNFRDDNEGALLVELCKKAIAICDTYDLYNANGDWKAVAQAQHRAMYGECKESWSDLVDDIRNWGANGANKHRAMCQKVCQSELGERVFLDQRTAMRAGQLHYQGHDHEKAVKRLYTLNNLMEYLAENATKFSPEEMCRDIIPACLKPRARVEYIKNGGEELVEKRDVISLVRTISRGIECEIEVQGSRKRTPKHKSGYDGSSESDDDRDDRDGGRRGGGGGGKPSNKCRIPGHNHDWKDCPNNRWSANYKGGRGRDDDDRSRDRSRSPPRKHGRHRDRDRDRDRNRETNRDRNRDRGDRHPRSDRRREQVSSLESSRSKDTSSLGSHHVRFDEARDSMDSRMDDSDQSSLHSYSSASRGYVY